MEQRPLRLGDIVDDYCPRERRITNHVIVAIVDDAVRQTRCSTCDAEHLYKEARMPRRRAKGDDGSAGTVGQLVSRAPDVTTPAPMMAGPESARPAAPTESPARPNQAQEPDSGAAPGENHPEDGWPAHRQLIRATLPRVEGEQKEPRPIPEFTMHQRQGHGRHGHRPDYWANGGGNGNANGNGNGNVRSNGSGGGLRPGPPSQPGQPGQGQPGGAGKRWRRRRRGGRKTT